MRHVLSLAALAAVFAVGCNKSPEGGAPGTDNKFTLSGPDNTIPTTIKQDNAESVKVSVNRGKDFKQAVKLAVTSSSDKVKGEFTKADVKPGDPADAVLKVSVAKDAPLGEHVLKVTGTPEGGTATSLDVKVKVAAP